MKLIIPYRNRLEHLQKFKEHYKGFDLLVVEQADNKLFNRGKLLNIGFNECEDSEVCFQDVDLLAHDLSTYKLGFNGAKHLSGLCEQFGYKPPYSTCFGGVTAFTAESLLKCNGFSNDFWGWGGEDDDLYNRAKINDIAIVFENNKYYSLKHDKQPITAQYSVNKHLCVNTGQTWQNSGLNSMRYSIVKHDSILGIERILVNL